MSLDDVLAPELEVLASLQRLRTTPILEGKGTARVAEDCPLLAFASNDYLGLAGDPRLSEAASRAAARWGTGAGGARLVTGGYPLQDQLERSLARFLDLPTALIFPSGYQANIGLITSLSGPEDLIVSDALNHASLIDGCRLSRSRVLVYRHADAAHAAELLATRGPWRRRFLLTESLFSMDGDVAPLAALASAAASAGGYLLVDEAHAFGTQGPGGRGACSAAGIKPAALMATFGKALGAAGAFVAGSAVLRSVLVNRARSFIFTTAPPPPAIAAAQAALEIVETEGSRLIATVHRRARDLRSALRPGQTFLGVTESPIVPLLLGTEQRALGVAAALGEAGIFAPAIRPPTVPVGACRIRFTVSAAHSEADLNRLIEVLQRVLA